MSKDSASVRGRRTVVHWIDSTNLPKGKVIARGYVGGCIRIRFLKTENGDLYFIREQR